MQVNVIIYLMHLEQFQMIERSHVWNGNIWYIDHYYY